MTAKAIHAPYIAILLMVISLFPEEVQAASDYATFESFYKSSSTITWILAGISALVAGVLIVYSGGMATPAVTSMGTWIGSLMGFHGVVATNAGLALVGGGSIASGGFGIVGGTALLTAALTFGSELAIEFVATEGINTYDYAKFVEYSKNMTTLPLPRSTKGPDSYQAAMDVLDNIGDKDIHSNHSQERILQTLKVLKSTVDSDSSIADKIRKQTLLSLLEFVSGNYTESKKEARAVMAIANKATLPAFILATSSLYDEEPKIDEVMWGFTYAIEQEFDNPLTPLLFSIFLDRLVYRFNDGAVSSEVLADIHNLSQSLEHDERKVVIQIGIINRLFIQIKLMETNILTLVNSENNSIKNSTKTLDTVRRALDEYNLLLSVSRLALLKQQQGRLSRITLEPDSFLEYMFQKYDIKDWEIKWKRELDNKTRLLSDYQGGLVGLEQQINALADYQAELDGKKAADSKGGDKETAKSQVWLGMMLLLGSLILVFAYRRRFLQKKRSSC